MRIFNLDICEDGSNNGGCDIQIWDLDAGNNECSDVKIWPGSGGCDVGIYIPGPPGPTGAQGPPGPAGSGAGFGYAIVTESTSIPMDQYVTVVNGASSTVQTLPQISSVLESLGEGLTEEFTVSNVTSFEVAIEPFSGDTILVGQPVLEPFINSSFTFVATPLGWIVI